MELELGLFENDTGHDNDQCIVVNRVVNDMENNIEDDRAEEYIDVIGGKPRRVKRSIQQKIDSLRDKEVPELVRFYGFCFSPYRFFFLSLLVWWSLLLSLLGLRMGCGIRLY